MSPRCRLVPLGAAALALSLAACSSTVDYERYTGRPTQVDYQLADPVLVIRGPEGEELGVCTEYGPVFLGRHCRSGEVELVAWFGDGPSIEACVVEPLGGGIYTATTEIRLPQVPIRFTAPEPGTEVYVRGRRGETRWQEELKVVAHPKLRGLLLECPDSGPLSTDAGIGAGVFVPGPEGKDHMVLLGLVCGRAEVQEGGRTHRYLVAVGADDLWRLVAWRRDWTPKPRWVYREDVL